ncbi:helix-turn-helix domain-containing protein [Streptomyces sp. NRRL S-448]|uniref:helix-turn-helix domain-containing protein n=1 Tax=Streptomyces sp. NRRL S-448 TaxID=1463907 RepID=UPI000A8B1FF0
MRSKTTVTVRLPGSALPVPIEDAQRLLAQRISGETGMGAIAGRFLRTLGSHGAECAPRDLDRLGRVAADLITACLAGHHDGAGDRTGGEPPAGPDPRGSLERIDTFIDHNLSDPGLTPQTIADRHHISVRRLHLMFQDRGESVAATIRRRRLEHCHADLARPALLARPIHAVAARWGFGSAAVFSRAFREAYGISPTERRAQARAADRPHPDTP